MMRTSQDRQVGSGIVQFMRFDIGRIHELRPVVAEHGRRAPCRYMSIQGGPNGYHGRRDDAELAAYNAERRDRRAVD